LIAAMRAVTKKDDQRLRQLLMRLRRRFLRGHVRRRWGAYTYSPYRCKQRSQS
jgi:type IV secretion system protein VirB3